MEEKKNIKKIIFSVVIAGIVLAGILVFVAYARTWGKTELEFRIHINEVLVMQSVYGESPTFAIWIEDKKTKSPQTIFVTSRAGLDDWEGKKDVPAALPKWDEINKIENESANTNSGIDAITGATPQPGVFTTRARVTPESDLVCWIEMNLSGDYNENYKEYDIEKKITDEYGTGQPALLYKAEIKAVVGKKAIPELVGMSILNSEDGKIVQPVSGITTAKDVFDEMSVEVVKPKPRIIDK